MNTPEMIFRNLTLLDLENEATVCEDLYIQDGKIAARGLQLPALPQVPEYDATGKMASIGWMDMHVHLREPGFEHKETIETGCNAAAFGGFTAVACMPNTQPPIHTADVVSFIIEKGRKTPVDVHPIACVSKGRAGKELAEMAELKGNGAVAFSDDGSPVQHGGLMRTALEYAAMIDAPIINHMEDLTLNPHGQIHEGFVSTRLGLSGIPALAEDVMIARDILLAEFTGGSLHVAHISTARGVELVREGKARGIPVTAEVCTHHFTLTDEEVERRNYDTNTKMHPPLRTQSDIEAILLGLQDGTIDVICTDHAPHARFEKEVEYIAAPFGILGLETAWGLIGRELLAKKVLTVAQAIRKITVAPRQILRLPIPSLAVGSEANLTIFDTNTDWVFQPKHIHSKSSNTPFVGTTMTGKAWGIYNRGHWVPALA